MSRATLEVSMIVKNGAATLQRALASVASVADRILVGDTGSEDATADVARHAGAEVIEVPWENDFSRARNHLLAAARCDWILVLDADEMFDPTGPALLTALLNKPKADAYDIVRWNYVRSANLRSGDNPPLPNPRILPAANAYPAYALSLNTRLFRRHPGVYFEGAVHETVADRIDHLGLKRIPANFVLHHLGQAEDEERVRNTKNEFYFKLGLQKIKAQPKNAAAWFEVGLTELEHYKHPSEALLYFEQARALSPADARSRLFSGICLTALGRLPEAMARLREAFGLGMCSPVLFEAIGDVYFQSGHYELARDAYQKGSISPLNQAKLGACEALTGESSQGLSRIQDAIRRCPEFTELKDILKAATKECRRPRLVRTATPQTTTL